MNIKFTPKIYIHSKITLVTTVTVIKLYFTKYTTYKTLLNNISKLPSFTEY